MNVLTNQSNEFIICDFEKFGIGFTYSVPLSVYGKEIFEKSLIVIFRD